MTKLDKIAHNNKRHKIVDRKRPRLDERPKEDLHVVSGRAERDDGGDGAPCNS